jgi:hypothetical protein
MDTPNPAAPGTSLSRDAYRHVIFTLRNAMPAVPDTGGDPAEALAWRDHAAVAQVAGFCPANPAEAAMAAEFVAAHAQAMAVLGEAQDPRTPPDWVPRCRAQAACMMRLAQGAVRALMRMQAARERRAGEQAAADWAAGHAAEMARARPAALDDDTGLSHTDGLDPGKRPHETTMSEPPSAAATTVAPPAGTHAAWVEKQRPGDDLAEPARGGDTPAPPGTQEVPGSMRDLVADAPETAPGRDVLPPHQPDAHDGRDNATGLGTSARPAPARPGLRQPPDAVQPPLAA